MPLEDTEMKRDGDPLDYATPRREPSVPMGAAVSWLGGLMLIGGIIWSLLGTAGLDNTTQIRTGCAIAAVGLIVAILGQILHAVETRR
jgi:hypothetical protein